MSAMEGAAPRARGRLARRARSVCQPPTFEDPELHARAALTHRILGILAALFSFLVLLTFIQPDAGIVDTAAVYGALFGILALSYVMLHRWRRVRAAGLLLTALLFTAVVAVVLLFGGIDSQAATGFVPVMLIAGLLLGSRWGFAVGVAAAVFAGGVAWIEHTGRLPLPVRHQGPIDHWVNFLATLGLVAVLARLSIRHLERAVAQARQNERAHLASLDELRVAQRAVERRARQSIAIGSLGQELLEARTRAGLGELTLEVLTTALGASEALVLDREPAQRGLAVLHHRRAAPEVRSGTDTPAMARTQAPELLALLDSSGARTLPGPSRGLDLPMIDDPRWLLVAPIPGRVRTQGLIVVGLDSRERPSPADELFVTTAAGVLGSALERDEADRRLRRSQRLEAVGQLAGGIAHDFNNLLTAILTCARIALRRLPPENAVAPLLRDIEASGERAALLTAQLLTFSRRDDAAVGVADVPHVLHGIESILGRLLGEHIQISVETPEGLPEVAIDPSSLEQIVLNLSVNARDAMPHGGHLRISVRVVDGEHLPPELELGPGSYVELTVEDDGEGIAEDLHDRIFEPFFSTKEDGRGTGLGLATVFGICRAAGGTVHLESQPGVGSAFAVYLPARAGRTLSAAPALARGLLEERTGRILVVEDNPLVRRSTVALLEGAGYDAVAAANGLEALSLLLEGPLPDLVLTDVRMPRMGGIELAHQIEQRALRVPTLFTSGYAADVETLPDNVRARLVQKPFRAEALVEAVDRAIQRARAAPERQNAPRH